MTLPFHYLNKKLAVVLALVVRFLAKRFLPQYDGETDKTYTRAVSIEEKLLNLKIIDKTGKVIVITFDR